MASRKRKKMTAYASGRAVEALEREAEAEEAKAAGEKEGKGKGKGKNAKSTAKKTRKAKHKRGTSPLARMAHARGLTIAQLRHEVEACGRWSVRRRMSTRKNPCR
jgi:hypothetical protein